MSRSAVRRVARKAVPAPVRHWLWRRHLLAWPPVGHARLGHLRRTTPISDDFGYDRGLPIDRHYIEAFLDAHAADVQGAALEFEDDAYLRRLGGGSVSSVDIAGIDPHPGVTLRADLGVAEDLPLERFDCILCTQVLQLLYDLHAAVENLHRMLRPGGVLLATVPGITRIARAADGSWEDQWRLTSASARRLFGEVFGAERVQVDWHGNTLAAIAFLAGLASQDLRREELDARHPDFEMVITVRAVRAGAQARRTSPAS
jgi:SAM-dependent methyltransferase